MSTMSAPLNILSAASYPDTLPNDRPVSPPSSASTLYGGLLLCADGADVTGNVKEARYQKSDGSTAREKQTQPKKRRAKKSKPQEENGSENGVENAAKKRGRPRVDTADETAAEVRPKFRFFCRHPTDNESPLYICLLFFLC